MKKTYGLLGLLIGCIFLMSCGQGKNKTLILTKLVEDKPTQDLMFNTFHQTKRILYFVEDSLSFTGLRKYPCVNTLRLVWPDYIKGYDLTALQQALGKTAFGTEMYEMMKKKNDFKKKVKIFMESSSSYSPKEIQRTVSTDTIKGESDVQDVEITLQIPSPNLLVFKVYNYSYQKGSAHGLGVVNFINYDVDSNKVITYKDLFVNDNQLSTLLLSSLLQKHNVRSIKELSGFLFEKKENLLTTNFFIGDDGITFSYPPYQIACYANGQEAIYLSYSTLLQANLLTPYAKALLKRTVLRNKDM